MIRAQEASPGYLIGTALAALVPTIFRLVIDMDHSIAWGKSLGHCLNNAFVKRARIVVVKYHERRPISRLQVLVTSDITGAMIHMVCHIDRREAPIDVINLRRPLGVLRNLFFRQCSVWTPPPFPICPWTRRANLAAYTTYLALGSRYSCVQYGYCVVAKQFIPLTTESTVSPLTSALGFLVRNWVISLTATEPRR